jgi:hypothetical protein
MARVFAEHAQAGKYHLETRYVEPGRWEWFAKPSQRKLPAFSGDAKTLDSAKQAACHSIGRAFADWKPIGPAIEVPD